MNFQTVLIAFVLSFVSGQDRKLQTLVNPGCDQCTNSTTLVYVLASGSHDTIHQIWDFSTGLPTMIFALTNLSTKLNFKWNDKEIIRFDFTEKPKYSFGTVLDRVYEYHEDGHTDPRCKRNFWSLKELAWSRSQLTYSDQEVMLSMRGRYPGKKDVVDVKLDLLPYQDYAIDLPHLIHTANSTLIDISLIDIHSRCGYNASRVAVRATLASTDAGDTARCSVRKSLDDEHTPGVFEIIEIQTPLSFTSRAGGFLQFRPVGYTEPARGVAASLNAHVSNLTRADLRNLPTMRRFFDSFEPVLAQDFIVSFGDDGENYQQHNYTAWSFTVGYGAPPVEGFSLFVVLIISIGLGVPVILAVSGIAYVVSRRCKQRRTERLLDE